MDEPKKRVSPKMKTSDQSLADSMDSKLGEIVNVLKSIDEKIEIITRAVREINLRG